MGEENSFLPGAVLFDCWDLIEAELNCEEFDATYFLDLCAAIDNAVVNEELHAVSTTDDSGSGREFVAAHPMTAALMGSGVLVVHEFAKDDLIQTVKASGAQEVIDQAFAELELTLDEPFDADLDLWGAEIAHGIRASRFVCMEPITGLSYVPNCHVAPLYLNLGRNRADQRLSRQLHEGLAGQYSDFREALLATRAEVEGDDFIRIPPIAYDVLSRCATLEELPLGIVDARDRFQKLRHDLAELDALLRSPDVSLKDKLKAKARMLHGVSYLNRPLGRDRNLAATSLAVELNADVEIEGLATKGLDVADLRWAAIIDKLIKAADAVYWRLRLRPMFATRQYYLSASRSDFSAITRRLFDHELTDDDLGAMTTYADFVSRRADAFYASG